MLTVEDVLAALAGRGRWFETGRKDSSDKKHFVASGVMRELEDRLHEIRQEEKEVGTARVPIRMDTAEGRQTRSKGAADGLIVALAEAISGMPGIEWAAIEWIVDGNGNAREKLARRLMGIARRSQDDEDFWPLKISRSDGIDGRKASVDYVPDLVTLVLMDLRFPNTFETQHSRAGWFGITDRHWRRLMLKPYGVLQVRTQFWLGGGCSHIARKLRRSAAASPE